MSDGEGRRRGDRKQPCSIGSDAKARTRSRRSISLRDVRQASAMEFVDRLELALRGLFGEDA